MMTLIVKGNRYQASRAAADRQIPAAFVWEITRANQSVLWVADRWTPELTRWFAEPTVAVPGEGHPPGTLLSFHKTEEAA